MSAFSSHRLVVILLSCIGVCLALSLLWLQFMRADVKKASNSPALRVGLEEHYPPMAFRDDQGRHTGFEHDLAAALCKQINAKCEFVIGSFDDVLRRMSSGELDIMIAGLAALDERRQTMDFTECYYRSRTVYVGRPGITISPEGLRGKKLGAQSGSIQLDYLNIYWSETAEIVSAPFEDVIGMLVNGEVDVILADALVCYDFLKSKAGLDFEILGDPLQIDDVLSHARIGVRKNSPELVASLDKALMALRLNGEYNRITRKYFAFSIY